MNDHKSYLSKAAIKLLKPLVRLLIRSGVGFATFSEWVKHAYVSVAEDEFALEKKQQSTSRISVLTGLHRKEVSRIRSEQDASPDQVELITSNRAERVIQGWLRLPEFLDKQEQPLTLNINGQQPSFSELVQQVSGDIPAKAILDELIRIGSVEKTDNDQICLISKGYVPTEDTSEKLKIMGQSAADLLATLDNNLDPEAASPRMQLSVAYDNLSKEDVEAFKQLSRIESEKLLIKLNQWLAERDRDTNPDTQSTTELPTTTEQPSTRHRSGIGIYYFENLTKGNKS